MWIRSQDNKTLVNTNNVTWFEVMKIDGQYAVVAVDGESSISIAYYHKEEIAVEALIEIQEEIRPRNEWVFAMSADC